MYSPTGHGTPRQFYTEAEQSPQKVMVFCAIHGSGKLFGPVFFEGNFRLNQHRYREMLEHTIFPQMQEELGEEWSSVIFQQDGARAHTANMVVNWLDTLFGDRVLSSRCVQGIEWSPVSPDLNPCDFFLWVSFLKIINLY